MSVPERVPEVRIDLVMFVALPGGPHRRISTAKENKNGTGMTRDLRGACREYTVMTVYNLVTDPQTCHPRPRRDADYTC